MEETLVESAELLLLRQLDGEPVPGVDPVPPGRYRVRAHARGRDLHYDAQVSEPSEQYWLCLWPAGGEADHGIRRLRLTDTAFAP
ncbi:hypothetical protein ACW9HQ_46140, partial [Nocardia gipuzkoensis]